MFFALDSTAFTTRSYMLPVDNDLAKMLGIEDGEFEQFYQVVYGLMENSDDDRCNANAFANDEQKQEMEAEAEAEANDAYDANYDANYANDANDE